jgi:hypothetical protein
MFLGKPQFDQSGPHSQAWLTDLRVLHTFLALERLGLLQTAGIIPELVGCITRYFSTWQDTTFDFLWLAAGKHPIWVSEEWRTHQERVRLSERSAVPCSQ